tara:strand:- start:55 stop:297 length:243 start_codon:yes stop_codon:yes gene_type:complete
MSFKKKGIGKLHHGRPIAYALLDEEDYKHIYTRKDRIRIGVEIAFFISVAYIIADIAYMTWFEDKYNIFGQVNQFIYMLP